MESNKWGIPDLGFGVGLRSVHYDHVLTNQPEVDWFEIISETYLDAGGKTRFVLESVAERYPVILHGVSLSIGNTDPLNREYLGKLKDLADRVRAPYLSDHLCWSGVNAHNTHDLLPMSYTEENVHHVAKRAREVQEYLERPLALENLSSYVAFSDSTLTEWEFLVKVAEEADCGILLDVNNVYVSSFNHAFNPYDFLRAIPPERVCQYHLAGHRNKGTHILDTHDDFVIDAVWDLYRFSTARTGGRPTLLEWDDNIPSFDVVHQEALKARAYRGVGTEVHA
jgi:uncharacterized protein (UPF0276 family)